MVAGEPPQGDEGQGEVDDLLVGQPALAAEHPQLDGLQDAVEGAVYGGEEVGKGVGDSHAVDDVGQKYHGLVELGCPQLAGEQHRKGQLDGDHAQMDHKVDRVVFQTLPQVGIFEHGDIVVKHDKVAGFGQAIPVGEAHTEQVDGREDHKAHQQKDRDGQGGHNEQFALLF